MARSGRNSALTTRTHLNKLSKTALKNKKAVHKRERKPAAAQEKADPTSAAPKSKEVGGSKNGGSRLIAAAKAPKFYPAEDVKAPKLSRKSKTAPIARLRNTLTPGTVLILLAGKNRGKRVVFVKQLPTSGLLLVTGPKKINGVGLRRVNQAYVIATSTKLDLSSLKVRLISAISCHGIVLKSSAQVDKKFNDAYFKKSATPKSKGSKEEFFNEKKSAAEVSPCVAFCIAYRQLSADCRAFFAQSTKVSPLGRSKVDRRRGRQGYQGRLERVAQPRQIPRFLFRALERPAPSPDEVLGGLFWA